MVVVGIAVVVDRRKTGRDLKVVGGMKVGRKAAEVDSKKLKTDLGHRTFGNQIDLVIVARRNRQNHPL